MRFLFLGAALGPQGLAVLTPSVLSVIDPAIPVALAALGVLVGLRLPTRSGEMRVLVAANVQAVLTGLVVAVGTLLILPSIMSPSPLQLWIVALAAGVCASASSPLPTAEADSRPPEMRLREVDVLVPIALSGLMLASMRESSVAGAMALAAQASIVAVVIAAAGWLLLSGAASETEQRVVGVAALLLIGGAADYLSLSALLSGLVAGAFWQFAGGPARESIHRDIAYVQHPLVVLLLLMAGARAEISGALLAFAAAYVLFRTTGKVVGAYLARGLARVTTPNDFPVRLISPGIFGIAFALNGVRALGPEVAAVLTAAVVGTIASELIARLAEPAEETA